MMTRNAAAFPHQKCRQWRNLPWLLLALLLAGCQPTVYLMPTPVAIREGLNPFQANPSLEASNRIRIFHATNRLSLGQDGGATYTLIYDDSLRLGESELEIGTEQTLWEQLYARSVGQENDDSPPLRLREVSEEAVLEASQTLEPLSPALRRFFDRLNERIDASLHGELTIYVHGANNNFYRGAAQAAQYQHFTGRNSVVMFFAWPSAASLLRYATDVQNTAASAPVFARLLQLLARHSTARHINILAYSAGAMVVSPALKILREQAGQQPTEELRRRLRIGEVYFAAPDVGFRSFLEDLDRYKEIVCNATLTVNLKDSVLGLAQGFHGTSRAGRPDLGELTEEETRWLIDASRHTAFDIIDVGGSEIPEFPSGAHDFWYQHPWVSSDVLVQFLHHARPAERGLLEFRTEDDAIIWFFPEDYPQRVVEAVRRLDASTLRYCRNDGNAPSSGNGAPAR